MLPAATRPKPPTTGGGRTLLQEADPERRTSVEGEGSALVRMGSSSSSPMSLDVQVRAAMVDVELCMAMSLRLTVNEEGIRRHGQADLRRGRGDGSVGE